MMSQAYGNWYTVMLGKDYIVIGANDGAEAIDIARKEKPDLILMDIMMPRAVRC